MSRSAWALLSVGACLLVAQAIRTSLARAEDEPPIDLAPPPPIAPDVMPETAPPPTADASSAIPLSEAPEPTQDAAAAVPIEELEEEFEASAALPEAAPPPAPETVEAAPAPEVPAPESPPSETRTASIASAKRHRWIPEYQKVRPAWGFAATGTLNAFGVSAQAAEVQFEYQFPFLQSIGVLSLGPSGMYVVSPTVLWSVGGQVRYQARFFREQPLVPMAGFEAQRVSDGSLLTGPSFGGMLLLNVFEPSSASELYINEGISRTYLLAEMKMLSSSAGSLAASSSSIFFGLRFEF